MKKNLTRHLVCLLVVIPLLFLYGCDDKSPYYGEGIDSEFNRYYSNKLAKDPVAGVLELTYSGDELIGKEIYFNLMSKGSAKLKFIGVFPGETETVIENLSVTEIPNGYTISGKYTTPGNTTFTCSGRIEKSEGGTRTLTLNLSDINIPSNMLSQKGTFEMMEYSGSSEMYTPTILGMYYNTLLLYKWKIKNEDGSVEDLFEGADVLMHTLLNNLLYLLLTDVTFHPDGNITATYSTLPDELGFMGMLGGFTDADREPKSESPKNLITYYVEGDNAYIRPDLTMILGLISANRQNTTRADGSSGGIDLGSILGIINVFPEIQRWLNEGIRFTVVSRDPDEPVTDYVEGAWREDEETGVVSGSYFFFGGDYALYLEEDELLPVIKVLPGILDLLGVELSFELMPGLEMDLNPLILRMVDSSKINIGLYLK